MVLARLEVLPIRLALIHYSFQVAFIRAIEVT